MFDVNMKEDRIVLEKLPSDLAELQALPEASLDSPFKTVALTIAALCNFENSKEATFEMLDFLNGPDDISAYDKSFITDRLRGKEYKPFSFFEGAGVDNGYTANCPYAITVTANSYSFQEENRAVLYVQSAGADSPRPLSLRRKPSTDQWFVTDIQCLADIRIPTSIDPWA